MIGIPFQLFRQAHFHQAELAVAHHFRFALHHAHQQAAARGTKRADARLPGRNTGNQILFRNKPDHLVLGIAARVESGRGARDSRNF